MRRKNKLLIKVYEVSNKVLIERVILLVNIYIFSLVVFHCKVKCDVLTSTYLEAAKIMYSGTCLFCI